MDLPWSVTLVECLTVEAVQMIEKALNSMKRRKIDLNLIDLIFTVISIDRVEIWSFLQRIFGV